jgi:hypothetical protein
VREFFPKILRHATIRSNITSATGARNPQLFFSTTYTYTYTYIYTTTASYIHLIMPPKGSRPGYVGKDPVWSEVTTRPSGKTNPIVTCSHCQKEWTSSAPTRIRAHLTICTNLPEHLLDEFQPQQRYPELQLLDSPLPPAALKPSVPRKRKAKVEVEFEGTDSEMDKLDQECAEWIYGTGLPLHTVDHPLFKKFVKSLRADYEPPPSWKLGSAMSLGNQLGLAGSLSDILRNQEGAFQ